MENFLDLLIMGLDIAGKGRRENHEGTSKQLSALKCQNFQATLGAETLTHDACCGI